MNKLLICFITFLSIISNVENIKCSDIAVFYKTFTCVNEKSFAEGSFGIFFLVKDKTTDKQYALKVIHVDCESNFKQFKKQESLIKPSKSEFVMDIIDTKFITEKEVNQVKKEKEPDFSGSLVTRSYTPSPRRSEG